MSTFNQIYLHPDMSFNSTTLKKIRGSGYSKLLTMLTSPAAEEPYILRPKAQPPNNRLNSNTPVLKKPRGQSAAYKLSLVSSSSPPFPHKKPGALEISQKAVISKNQSTHVAAYFPKRTLNCMVKKYSNFKSVCVVPNEQKAICVARLVGSPLRAKSRMGRYTKTDSYFPEEKRKENELSNASSDIWDSLEPRNITFDYL